MATSKKSAAPKKSVSIAERRTVDVPTKKAAGPKVPVKSETGKLPVGFSAQPSIALAKKKPVVKADKAPGHLISLDDLIRDMKAHWENRKDTDHPSTPYLLSALCQTIVKKVDEGQVDTDLTGEDLDQYVKSEMGLEE